MNHLAFQDQINRNKLKSTFLLVIIFATLIALGYIIALISGPDYFFLIMIIAILFSTCYTIFGYYNAHTIAIKSVNATKASQGKYPMYHNVVEGLCLASGMPKPQLYIMQDNNINAFASGRNPEHSVICVTTGCLEKLTKRELEGVLAHELSHIANYDIRFMTITAVLVGMIAILAEIFLRSLFFSSFNSDRDNKAQAIFIIIGILLAILAPIVTTLIQLSISRKREFSADASAVKFIRSPTGLKGALQKIKQEHQPTQKQRHQYNKAVAPLFISDPFKRKISGLFATHPSIDKRIAILERM